MSGLTIFQINLDNPTGTFNPGELIVGNVIIDSNKSKKVRAIKLRFKGKCTIRWTENHRNSSKTFNRHRIYHAEEEYFNHDIILFGNAHGETLELPPGHHNYPFTYPLPRNIPNSFQHEIGNVRYSIKAILDRPWKFDHETTTLFTVESPYELHLNHFSQNRVDDETQESYCCCILPCISQGGMNITYQIPTLQYACGENIEVLIKLDNNSNSVDVTKISLQLVQELKFHATTKTKSETNDVQKQKNYQRFPKFTQVRMGLTVPTLPHSTFPYCNLIEIDYKIRIIVHVSGCHCATDRSYDIVIGARPATVISSSQPTPVMTSYPISNFLLPNIVPSAPMDSPSAPLFPDQYSSNTNAPYPMPMPIQPDSSDDVTKNNNSPVSMPTPYPTGQSNLPYPPSPGNFQQTSLNNFSSLPPPPSYEDVIASKK